MSQVYLTIWVQEVISTWRNEENFVFRKYPKKIFKALITGSSRSTISKPNIVQRFMTFIMARRNSSILEALVRTSKTCLTPTWESAIGGATPYCLLEFLFQSFHLFFSKLFNFRIHDFFCHFEENSINSFPVSTKKTFQFFPSSFLSISFNYPPISLERII